MEKPLEAAYVGPKLDGVGYQEITRVGRTVLARLKETYTWHLPDESVGEGPEKEQWPLPTLLSGRKL